MRRWAAVTAFLTIPYGLAFLVHERPPTGGHALAGLVIVAAGIFLLGGIAALSRQPTRTNAIWLLVFQIVATGCAVGALLLQQLPFTTVTFLALLAFVVPIVSSFRHLTPAAWTPKPITDRQLLTNVIVEAIIAGGLLALMIWLHRYPIGLLLSVIVGSIAIYVQIRLLLVSRSLNRLERRLSDASAAGSVDDAA